MTGSSHDAGNEPVERGLGNRFAQLRAVGSDQGLRGDEAAHEGHLVVERSVTAGVGERLPTSGQKTIRPENQLPVTRAGTGSSG